MGSREGAHGAGGQADAHRAGRRRQGAPGGAENVITVTAQPVGGEPYQLTFNQYIYPSAPFSEGEDVTVKVAPDDPNEVMIWGKG